MSALVVSRCPRCHRAYGGTNVADAWPAWLKGHLRSRACRMDSLAGDLFAMGLAPFEDRHGLPLGVPTERHPTRAPFGLQLWGATPLTSTASEQEQDWAPLWVRVVADVYEVLLSTRVAGQGPLFDPFEAAALRGYRNLAVEALLPESETQEALASVYLIQRDELLERYGDARRVAPSAFLQRAADLLDVVLEGLAPTRAGARTDIVHVQTAGGLPA